MYDWYRIHEGAYRELLIALVADGGRKSFHPVSDCQTMARFQQMVVLGFVDRPSSCDPYLYEVTQRGLDLIDNSESIGGPGSSG